VVTIAVLILVCGALLANNLGWPDTPPITGVRILLAGLVLLSLLVFTLFRSAVAPPVRSALGRPRAVVPQVDEIVEAWAEVIASYDERTLNLFARILFDLPTYVDRINEDATLEDAPLIVLSTRQQYVVRAGGSDEAPEMLLLPLVRPEKGTLLDTFSVTDAAGGSVATLSHNRVRGLLAYSLTALFRIAAIDSKNTDDRRTQEAVNAVLAGLIMAVCAPGPIAKQNPERRVKILAALQAVDGLPFHESWRDRIRRFCAQYVDFYVVVAEANTPAGKHLVLRYSHRVPCESATGERLNRWRIRLGLAPTVIDLPLNAFAFQVSSYHLQISSDVGQYVFDHHLERLDTRSPVSQDDLQVDGAQPYVRLHYHEGRPNAHLYVRRQGIDSLQGMDRLKSVVQFREIPPGVMGGATVVAWASTALITFFALTHLGLGDGDDGVATDMPAILLALPAFTAAIIGSWSDLARLRRASLTTYLALFGTMLLSLVSALYFVYDASKALMTEFRLELPWQQAITTEVGWLAILVLSWTLGLFLVRQWLSESRHYFGAVKRRIDRKLR